MRSSKRFRIYYCFLIVYFIVQLLLLRFNHRESTDFKTQKFTKLYKELVVQLNENAKSDSSGMYKIMSLQQSDKKTSSFDITVVSQCSANHIEDINKLLAVWKGPISMAVFSEIENIEESVWDMAKLLYCNRLRDIQLQLVVPFRDKYINNFTYGNDLDSDSGKSDFCKIYKSAKRSQRNYEWMSPYPVNLLRNVAKSKSSTDFILIIDIDMVPSLNLRSDFLNFIKKRNSKNNLEVYVVPIFEIPIDASDVTDKGELMKRVKMNEARPFYLVPCRNCQKSTKYGEWLSTGNTTGTNVLYSVDWKHPWEPFFIAKRTVPDFDERFKQYGKNRVSQICELHVAGYKFLVMDNIFLVHKGYKLVSDFHQTKNIEMDDNGKLYSMFKIELMYRYPESNRSC